MIQDVDNIPNEFMAWAEAIKDSARSQACYWIEQRYKDERFGPYTTEKGTLQRTDRFPFRVNIWIVFRSKSPLEITFNQSHQVFLNGTVESADECADYVFNEVIQQISKNSYDYHQFQPLTEDLWNYYKNNDPGW